MQGQYQFGRQMMNLNSNLHQAPASHTGRAHMSWRIETRSDNLQVRTPASSSLPKYLVLQSPARPEDSAHYGYVPNCYTVALISLNSASPAEPPTMFPSASICASIEGAHRFLAYRINGSHLGRQSLPVFSSPKLTIEWIATELLLLRCSTTRSRAHMPSGSDFLPILAGSTVAVDLDYASTV